jgi:hypothetical protein
MSVPKEMAVEFLQGAMIDEKRREGRVPVRNDFRKKKKKVPVILASAARAFGGYRTCAGQRGDKGLGGAEGGRERGAGGGEALLEKLLEVCEAAVIRGCAWPTGHIGRWRGRGCLAEGTGKIRLVPAINREGRYDGAMI